MTGELGAELLKTRKRWLPYGLFAVAVLGAVVLMLPGGYLEWRQAQESDPGIAATAFRTFVFPYSIPALLDSGQYWGAMLTGILAASVVATEYRWGTVRQALIRGQPRVQYLALKVAAVSICACAMLLAALAIGLAISLYTTDVAGETITLDVPGGPTWPDIGLMVLRAAWCIVPYGMFALMLAVVSRSSMAAVTGIIVFLFGEALAIALLDSLGGIGDLLQDISVGENVKTVMAENHVGFGDHNAISLRQQVLPGESGDANTAALVIAAHTALYAAIAFTVFHRRDVTG